MHFNEIQLKWTDFQTKINFSRQASGGSLVSTVAKNSFKWVYGHLIDDEII